MEDSVVCCWCQRHFDQRALLGKTRVVRMGRGGPVNQEAFSCRQISPEESAVIKPAQILMAGIFA